MIDTFEVKSFLSPAECAALRAELRQTAGAQAYLKAMEALTISKFEPGMYEVVRIFTPAGS